MSLIRQIWLLLLLTLVLAFVGGFGLSTWSARHYLTTQISLKNSDSAQSLAAMLASSDGRLPDMVVMLDRQFEMGFYQELRLLNPQGQTLVLRQSSEDDEQVPGWFVDWLGIQPRVGVAAVRHGPIAVGTLEVLSSVRFAQHELWRASFRALTAMAGIALTLGLVAWWMLGRLRRPLNSTVNQALALMERRFVTVPEPGIPELRKLTQAMNHMVERLKSMFEEQAAQVEQWRKQAHADPMTGVSNRIHFMMRLKWMLESEDGAAGGILLLIRVNDLQGLNRRLGRLRTDELLRDMAHSMLEAVARYPVFEIGRLNGSDFALVLPDVGSLRESAMDLMTRLRNLWRDLDPPATVVIGAVRWWHGAPASSLLAAADHALAKAEARGPYAVELDDTGDAMAMGEDSWRQRLQAAVRARQASIAQFPLVDVHGTVVHWECPLRLLVDDPSAPSLVATQWLPMARRTGLTAPIDLLAIELALAAIDVDGSPRSVNLSPDSLQDPNFFSALRGLLDAFHDCAPGLWLEVPESGALQRMGLLRELVGLARARGARVGLEHAGEQTVGSSTWMEVGLDFMKLDASLVEGVAAAQARLMHVQTTVRMLHGLGLKVYAEGVRAQEDMQCLWECGLDGLTGPAVTGLYR